MSRSGYHEDYDDEFAEWALIRWRGAVTSAMRGKRGQAFFREAIAALDAMPEKRLITNELETAEGDVCFLGAVGRARGLDMAAIDPDCPEQVAGAFDIAPALARETVYENDDCLRRQTPEGRWASMRRWAEANIVDERGRKPKGEAE